MPFWFVSFDVNPSGCDLRLKKFCAFNNSLIDIPKIFISSSNIKGLFDVKGLLTYMPAKKILLVSEKGPGRPSGTTFKRTEHLI